MAWNALVFFSLSLPCQNHCVGAGLWVLLVAAVTLSSQLPYPIIFLCIALLNIYTVYGIDFLIFYACLRLRFLYVENNHSLQCAVPAVCRILSSNVLAQSLNLGDLTVAALGYDILLCSETLVSDMRDVTEMLVPRFGRLVLLRQVRMHLVRGFSAYVRDGYGAFRQPKFECSR